MNRKRTRRRRSLVAESLERRNLLAVGFFSPGPTVLPTFNAATAEVAFTEEASDAFDEHEHHDDDDDDHEFPILNEAADDGAPSDAPLTNADTFKLHSNPGSDYTIYLDFDGSITEGTAWNNSTGITTLVDIAYNRSGSSSSFTNSELNEIRSIWKLVAEDFAPFDVNVTTEDPGVDALRKSGSGDTQWGIRSLHTSNTNSVCGGCGGVAYIGSFSSSIDLPAYSFNKGVSAGGNTQSHEVGHAVRLGHDGISGGTTYYAGHGSSNTTWGPIMGGPGSRKVKTWSNGDYFNANNQQDDLDRISSLNGFSYRVDDHGNTFAVATPLEVSGGTSVSDFGVIERTNDVDVFAFRTIGGNVSFDIKPYVAHPNLDVWAGIYDSSGELVSESNPFNNVSASFTDVALTEGDYYLKIDGVGTHGFHNPLLDAVFDPGEADYTGPETEIPWAVSGPTGYSDYASVGQYWITGTLPEPSSDLIEIQAIDSVKMEGAVGETTAFTFEISRTGDTSGPVDVDYSVQTASPESDNNNYAFTVDQQDFQAMVLPAGTVTIPANETSTTLTIEVQGDGDFERNEFFDVTIGNASPGWTITESTAQGTILSDEASIGIKSMNSAMAVQKEGDPAGGGATYTYTLFRRGDTSGTTTADWQAEYDGFTSAADDADFLGGTRPSGQVTFGPGVSEVDITVQVIGDLDKEADESFRVAVISVGGDGSPIVDPATPSRRSIIQDDEAQVTVTDQVQFRWRQIRNGSGTRDAWAIDNVSLSTTGFGDDFDPDIDNPMWASIENGAINLDDSIFPGTNEQELLMQGTGNRIATTAGLEPSTGAILSFDLIIGNGISNNGADNAETGKDIWLEYTVNGIHWEALEMMEVNDYQSWTTVDVPLPNELIITNDAVQEGDADTTNMSFQLVRTGNLNKAVSVNWQIAPVGTNPIDVNDVVGTELPSGSVSFAVNETLKTVTVPIQGDEELELSETYDFSATSSNALVTGGSRTATIVNDDFPGVISTTINDGAPQRSSITEVHVLFDTLVDAPAAAFTLTNIDTDTPVTGLTVTSSDNPSSQTVATIKLTAGGSLTDANYRLDIDGGQVVQRGGGPSLNGDYAFGDEEADAFYRKYGDSDGNGFVNLADFGRFRATFGLSESDNDPDYDPIFDNNNDASINLADFGAFRANFGT